MMLPTMDAHMRAAMIPIVWPPMTSAVRSNMRASVPVMVVLNRRAVLIVVFIVVRLRKASEADDQG
jgi:hypothetical protein